MTDEVPFRITLQVSVVGGTDRGKTAIAIVCEGRWPRRKARKRFCHFEQPDVHANYINFRSEIKAKDCPLRADMSGDP